MGASIASILAQATDNPASRPPRTSCFPSRPHEEATNAILMRARSPTATMMCVADEHPMTVAVRQHRTHVCGGLESRP